MRRDPRSARPPRCARAQAYSVRPDQQLFKQWLEEPAGVQIPDCDALQADACGPGYRYDALTRLLLESKEDMRRRGALSPDLADAVVLTFAQPVSLGPSRFNRKIEYPPTGWM